jgi:hypothetical protein
MREARAFTYGIALGAAVMYLMDPRQGGARRALVRDKSVRAVHELENAAAIGARDLSHRAQGMVSRLRGNGAGAISEDILVARVRAALGHASSHPHGIHVVPKGDGCIELVGAVLASEVDDVIAAVSRVKGVESVDNDLEVHDKRDVPSLQGEGRRRSRALRVVPATKVAFGSLAAVLALASLVRGHAFGFLLGGAAALGFARSVNAHGSWTPLRALERRRLRRRQEVPQMPDRSADAGFVSAAV